MAKQYTPEEIDTALLTYWAEGQRIKRAATALEIPESTLGKWVNETHTDRLAELIEKNQPLLDKAILRRVEAAQIAALDTISLAIEQAQTQLLSGPVKNPDQMAQRLATTMGILTDKSLILQGRPNQITQSSDASEHLKALKARFPWLVVDSTAEEIEPAQIAPNAEKPA